MKETIWQTARETWPINSGWGNHRVVVEVFTPSNTRIKVQWRRRDLNPEKIGLRIMNLATKEEIKLIRIEKIDREDGIIVFNAPKAGLYGIYYMPYHIEGNVTYFPNVIYMKNNEMQLNENWLQSLKEDTITNANLLAIECRKEFDSFYPMEIPATKKENESILSKNSNPSFLLFPEDREHPIKMLSEIPYRWIEKGSVNIFEAQVCPEEYYVFQVGLWALEDIKKINVEFENNTIPVTCFNTEGVDYLGKSFTKEISAQKNTVLPLWFGVDLPKSKTDTFNFNINIKTSSGNKAVSIKLTTEGEAIKDRGDKEIWRLSRLRWLNSTIGIDSSPNKGYIPLNINDKSISFLGREVILNNYGLPNQIKSFFSSTCEIVDTETKILSDDIKINILKNNNSIQLNSDNLKIVSNEGNSTISTDISCESLSGNIISEIEFDGHIDTTIELISKDDLVVDDFQLEIPIKKSIAKYMVGMGIQGCKRPAKWDYEWNIERANNYIWLGSSNAGIQLKLKHNEDVWELTNYKKTGLPQSWCNDGKGGCSIYEKDDSVLVKAYTKSFKFEANKKYKWRFAILITPVKVIDSDKHWNERYYHVNPAHEDIPNIKYAKKLGANIVNLHQGGSANPYINYPFLNSDELNEQTSLAHQNDMKYKIYYTVRELSNHSPELWALRALNDEILKESESFNIADHFLEDKNHTKTGAPWLLEHLVEGFVPAWQQLLNTDSFDAALRMNGLSRWHNYYMEGLKWIITKNGVDGLYLDGIGYDREIMKRVRKTLDSSNKECLIDFHEGNNFEECYGFNNSSAMNLELIPCIDSLWFGEAFDYENSSPEYWLVDISGIPFGLMGEMLQDGGNPWRGMLFGMTCRCGWVNNKTPEHLWKFMDIFGMKGSKMHGWWSETCPVKTDNDNIKATIYIKENKALIAIASWEKEKFDVSLNIDLNALRFLNKKSKLKALEIKDFQKSAEFLIDEPIPIEANKGWLLILE